MGRLIAKCLIAMNLIFILKNFIILKNENDYIEK